MVTVDINAGAGPRPPPAPLSSSFAGHYHYGVSNASTGRNSGGSGSVYRKHLSGGRRASGGASGGTVARSPPNLDAALTDLPYSSGYGGITGGSTSSASQRSSGASLLCRCGSGGALLPQSSSPPSGAVSFARSAQSLPSTPNACRRPLSPSMRTFALDADTGAVLVGPCRDPCRDEPCYALYGTAASNPGSECGVAMSESAVLANSGGDEGPPAFRALHHWTQQRRNLRYRTASQPLMKLSTLIIVLLAFLIIGFIVLSPLFHYLMS